jgi:hypothetical protein
MYTVFDIHEVLRVDSPNIFRWLIVSVMKHFIILVILRAGVELGIGLVGHLTSAVTIICRPVRFSSGKLLY